MLGCTEKTPHASKLMIRILVGDQNPKERKKMVKEFFILVKSFHCCKSADSLHWYEAASRPANALASLSFPDPFLTPGPACVYRFSDLPSLTAFPADFML